ncbi:tetratricopeptide repeat protein [Aureibacter tunicatorum]|uniref:Tetratricopeptide (TPR) repeat protein n=1 Tax=Aureibacter tunicatorum TaxID=866807 RepID=A0AAE4BV60_9BACT|nr:hypothetical protein [Aureibacter tunicatorum]MDR6241453.1 tetratricopeptide (TPR) repeat protein [Aureibacter tunicatorum]BDD06702.1 hypothetical protein AUTU_41850 [Aureibacter tunicatorum]
MLDTEIKEIKKSYKEACPNFDKLYSIKSKLLLLKNQYPDNIKILTNLGAVYSDLGKPTEALPLLTKAKSLGSKDANLHRNIGIVKIKIASERKNAIEYFHTASQYEKDPLTIEAYFDPHGH